jgi:hypothetical protein
MNPTPTERTPDTMSDNDYDTTTAGEVDISIRKIAEAPDGRNGVIVFLRKTTRLAGHVYRSLIVRRLDTRSARITGEVQLPRGAMPTLRRAADLLDADEAPAPVTEPAPAPAPAPPPPPSQPGVLGLDDATRARVPLPAAPPAELRRLGVTRPLPERPRRIEPLPPSQRVNGGR